MYFEDKIPATLHVDAPLTLAVNGVSYTFGIRIFSGDEGFGGLSGAVPAPAAGDASDGKYLSADGTWKVPVIPPNPGGLYGEVQWNNNGALDGFTVGGDATLDTSTGVLTIASGAVTLAKMGNIAANSIVGNNTGSPATPLDLTGGQVTAMLSNVVGDSGSGGTKGLVPAPGAGDAAAEKYLKADGTWAVPPGTGGSGTPGGSNGQVQYNNAGGFGGFTVGGDGTLNTGTGALIVTKTNGVSFGGLAVKTIVDWGDILLTAYGQTNVSGAVTLDRDNGECHRLSITGNVTSLSISNFGIAGKLRKLVLEIWNTGAFTFAWPVGTIWPGGVAPTVTSGASKKDVVVLMTMDGGTTIYGTVVGQDYA